jgi:hypothetical protein
VRRKILFLPQLHLIPWKSRNSRSAQWDFGRAGQTRIKKSFAVHCITLIIGGDVFGRILILCVLSHVEYHVGIKIVKVLKIAG